MAKPDIVGPSRSRAVLAGAAALLLLVSPLAVGEAAAKVGVTSATDGDPLGKPPAEAERVLHVGVDVQANEVITTKAGDRAHLVFLDGTSLTVGPDALVIIDRFVYDPQSKTGDLAITASKGVFRLVGGKISKNTPIVINTPSNSIGIRGGITMFDVGSTKTVSIFVFGFNMTIGANGKIETVTRPGSVVTTNFGGFPGAPRLLTRGELNTQLSMLEGAKKGGNQPPGGGNADQSAQSSGFSNTNSGQGTNASGPGNNQFGTGPGPGNRNPNPDFANFLTQPGSIAPTLQPVPVTNAINTANTMISTITFRGDMIGFVANNGSSYIANGTLQQVWNVGSRSGVISATFDGATYGGGTVAAGATRFTTPTSLPSVTGPAGRSLNVTGAFVGPQNAPTAQIGGFTVTGPRYGAVGGFVGTKQ